MRIVSFVRDGGSVCLNIGFGHDFSVNVGFDSGLCAGVGFVCLCFGLECDI